MGFSIGAKSATANSISVLHEPLVLQYIHSFVFLAAFPLSGDALMFGTWRSTMTNPPFWQVCHCQRRRWQVENHETVLLWPPSLRGNAAAAVLLGLDGPDYGGWRLQRLRLLSAWLSSASRPTSGAEFTSQGCQKPRLVEHFSPLVLWHIFISNNSVQSSKTLLA